jgi:hypothetical protein
VGPRDDAKPDTIRYEFAKDLAQFVTISGLGGLVAFVIGNEQRARDEAKQAREQQDAALKEFLAQVTATYVGIKRARRTLRAEAGALDKTARLKMAVYDEQMTALNEAQLEFEEFKWAVEAFANSRFDATEVRKCFAHVEKYLNKVLKEYRDNRKSLPLEFDPTVLGRLTGLLGDAEAEDGFYGASKPFHRARRALTTALVGSHRPSESEC